MSGKKVNPFVDGDFEAKYWSAQLANGSYKACIDLGDGFDVKDKTLLPDDYANEKDALDAARRYICCEIERLRGRCGS